MVTPFLVLRGLGKRLNPLALEARDSRFKSGVPDQFFDNLAVNYKLIFLRVWLIG